VRGRGTRDQGVAPSPSSDLPTFEEIQNKIGKLKKGREINKRFAR
jgi:hypothetical protein